MLCNKYTVRFGHVRSPLNPPIDRRPMARLSLSLSWVLFVSLTEVEVSLSMLMQLNDASAFLDSSSLILSRGIWKAKKKDKKQPARKKGCRESTTQEGGGG